MEASKVSAGSGANTLGKYRLIAELGHGGMAEVFLAVVRGPAGFNKLMVIKQIRPQLADDPEFLGMFLDEARLAARLSHPNVVQTNEVGEENNLYFIAMEYLEGQPLNRVLHRLQKSGGFPTAMHIKATADALAGLHHAHELTDYDGTPLNVVHRDLTPHNVFVTYDGQIKVVDFGIAKAMNSSSETRTGVLKGKVAYMAPEQARGEKVDRRADIFSVGVMLWEAAVGKRLWKGVPDITILQRLLAGDVPTPRSVNPAVPEKLEAIILKALAHQREERYDTAAELQNALETYLDDQGERVKMSDLGKLVASHFEADRTKIKGIVEEQLRHRDEAVSLPVIDQITHSSTSLERISMSGTGSNSSKIDIIGPGASSASYTAPSALFASSASAQPEISGRSRRGLVAGVALLLGAAFAVAFWMVAKGPAGAPANAGTSAQTAPANPAQAPSAPTEVELSIKVSPAEAKLFLDDKALGANPYKGKLPKDGASHTLRIEAPGFMTKTENVTFDKDRAMDLLLEKEAGALDKQPARPTRATGPAAPADDGMSRPVAKPKRSIATDNPYK